ncbi:thermonuclease family protein [Notoacmeibacter sp. MSK16QG-6]|uniref:thermonuclease family protein n=1 Tax=Notoacmeibacter sp. MSK16QG-6 TaxID=2957982 RepID=UPI0020A0564C|nr:thermonuclease family protein [Notoacmeibacter sp. MSK16QG-6]MCP1199281.1 thermonuclease family protein [Notoacmeibacter sp. MSK16QG-6]
MRFACMILCAMALCPDATAGDIVSGPITVSVVNVIDGDSFVADALVWPGMRLRYTVRVKGMDTPETRRAGCEAEKQAGLAATRRAETLLRSAPITLIKVEADKYYGRVLADVRIGGGRDMSDIMIDGRYALPYHGGKRIDWCGGGATAARVIDRIVVGATD